MEPRKYDETTQLEGRLARVKVERDGWFAGEVSCGNRNESISGAIAKTPGIGCQLVMTGKWTNHPTYGDQFKFTTCQVSLPNDVHGVIEFLKTIDNIGSVRAKAIASKLGSEAISKILADPNCLVGIQGISHKLAAEINVSIEAKKNVAVVEQLLCSFGLGTSLRKKVLERYGSKTEQIVRDEPYTLVDIQGITFASVDRGVLATRKIPYGEPSRIAAACVQAVKNATQWGHTWVDMELLAENISKLEAAGPIPIESVPVGLERAIKKNSLHRIGANGVTTPEIGNSEALIASTIAKMVLAPRSLGALDFVDDQLLATLTEEQLAAVKMATLNKVMVMTGGPGRGKTHTLKAIIQALDNPKIAICAPTGKAAKRAAESIGMAATTIHRLIGYIQATLENPGCAGELPDTVIIDEISMVDVVLLANLIRAFGTKIDGVRFVFVGDADQLPSIGPGRILSDIIESECVPVARLTKPMRQAEFSTIITNADLINQGEMIVASTNGTHDWFFVEEDNGEKLAEIIVKLVAERASNLGYDPIKDVAVLSPQRKSVLGVNNMNAAIRERLNPPSPLKKELEVKSKETFRVGDRVLVTVNDYSLMVVNGDTGTVTGIESVKLGDEKNVIHVLLDDDSNVSFTGDSIDILTQAWAMTVHKSQGSEYPMVVMVMHDCMTWGQQKNLLYTGITRGKQTVVLCGTSKAVANAIKNDRPTIRFTRLRELLNGLIDGKPIVQEIDWDKLEDEFDNEFEEEEVA